MPIAARVRALAAYKDFLTLWKDAEPDFPILKASQSGVCKAVSAIARLIRSVLRHVVPEPPALGREHCNSPSMTGKVIAVWQSAPEANPLAR